MRQSPGQKRRDEYRSELIRHLPDSNSTVQICKQSAEQTEADCIRTHRTADDINYKTYCERGYNRLSSTAINRKKHEKDQQQVRLDIQARQYAGLQNSNRQNKPSETEPPLHLNILRRRLLCRTKQSAFYYCGFIMITATFSRACVLHEGLTVISHNRGCSLSVLQSVTFPIIIAPSSKPGVL